MSGKFTPAEGCRAGRPRYARLSVALIPFGLIFACSEQAEDEPSQAPAADSAPVLEDRDTVEDAHGKWGRYANARFDFAIEVPPGFVSQPRPENGDGRVFVKDDSQLRVSGRYNLDSQFDDQIAAAARGLTILSQEKLSPATWRATAQLQGNKRAALMLARGAEKVVTARFEYPDNETAKEEQAKRTLSSLVFQGHAGPLTYRYQPGRYTSAPVIFSLPGARDWPVEGDKLIPWERASQLGRPSCRYGLSGRTQVCSAEKEPGLTFAVIDRPLARLREQLPAALAEPTTLAGRDGVGVVEEAEGSGASYILVPAGSQTIAVVRSWRKGSDGSGYQAVLRDISFESQPDRR